MLSGCNFSRMTANNNVDSFYYVYNWNSEWVPDKSVHNACVYTDFLLDSLINQSQISLQWLKLNFEKLPFPFDQSIFLHFRLVWRKKF